ncbi:NUDIX domain-containing protein [Patescibacteria group bacterium]|nr:NUDIX domain-containing protein [Patescibacteria group bacterium]
MKKAVKIILVNKDNKVLLQLRDAQHSHSGSWSLFGGHIDEGETPADALIREIKEELNHELTNFQFIKKTMVDTFGEVYWYQGIMNVGLSELTLIEGDDFNFFTYGELSKLKISPESKKRLIEFFEKENAEAPQPPQ